MTSPNQTGEPSSSFALTRQRTRSESRPTHSPHMSVDFSGQVEKGKYVFHRKLDLEDLTVLGVDDSKGQRDSFEFLSPDKSFAVVACKSRHLLAHCPPISADLSSIFSIV